MNQVIIDRVGCCPVTLVFRIIDRRKDPLAAGRQPRLKRLSYATFELKNATW